MRDPELPQRRFVVELAPVVDLPQREVGLRQIRLKPEGGIGGAPRLIEPASGPLREMELRDVDPGELGEGQRKGGVQLGGPDVHLLRRAVGLGVSRSVEVVVPAQVEVVCAKIVGRLGGERLLLRLLERQVQRGRDLLGDPRLHLKHLLERLVVAPGPEVAVVGDADELRRNSHPARPPDPLPAHPALEDVVHPQLPSDFLDRFVGLPVLVGAGAGDDAEAGDHGQAAGDLLGDAVAEVVVPGGAQVLEGEDGDRGRLRWLLAAVGETEREQQRGRGDGAQADERGRPVSRGATEACRSPGSLANAFASAPSTRSGTSGRRERIGGSGATTCWAMTDWGVEPVNGGSPPSIS